MRQLRFSPLLLLALAAGCGMKNQVTAPVVNATGAQSVLAAHGGRDGGEGRDDGDDRALPGAVYTLTNGTSGNSVLAFPRSADGTLGAPTAFMTGGTGTGAGLGNQGALILSREDGRLFAVNAGSNEISVLQAGRGGLSLVDKVGSGGVRPISLTRHGRLLYVLNAGGDGNITGFRIQGNGHLEPIPGSTQGLGGTNVGPAQIGFSPDGEQLVVTEKVTSMLAVFEVSENGRASAPRLQPSSGSTPFGFAFDRQGTLVVSEAFPGVTNGSAASSYRSGGHGGLAPVSRSVPTKQTAACWTAIPDNGRFAYTANAGSNSITGFVIGADGALTRLDDSGITAVSDDGPVDLTFGAGGRYLYVLNGRAHTVTAYRRSADGHLAALTGAGGLPAGDTGLAAN